MQIDRPLPQLPESVDFALRVVIAILILSVLAFILTKTIRFFVGEKGRSLGSRKLWLIAFNLILLVVVVASSGGVLTVLQDLGNRVARLLPILEPSWPPMLLAGIFYTVGATLAVVLFLQLTGAAYWWARGRVEAASRKFGEDSEASVSSVQPHLLKGLRLLVDGLRIITIAIGLLVFVASVFRFFPRTSPFVIALMHAVGTPAQDVGRQILDYVPNLGYLVVIFTIGWIFLRLARYVFDSIEAETLTVPGFDPDWAIPTYKLFRVVSLIFLLMVSFPYLPGANSQFFQGFSVFVGALLTLGSAGAIGNIIAGVILTYTGAFRLGDWVSIGDTKGEVEGKSLLVTRIRTINNVTVTVPNGMVVASHVLNFSRAEKNGLVLSVKAGIGYDVDWRLVHKLMIDAAAETEYILPEPTPRVWQEHLGDYAVTYELRAYTDRPLGMDETHSSLRRNVLDAFNRAGVEIMTPSVLAHRDATGLAVPEGQGPERPKQRGISVEVTTGNEG